MSGKRTPISPVQTQGWEFYDGSAERTVRKVPRTLPWAKDNSIAVHKLLAEMEKPENFIILFGKKDKMDVSHYNILLCHACSALHRTHRATQR